jgi:hypothetical protein
MNRNIAKWLLLATFVGLAAVGIFFPNNQMVTSSAIFVCAAIIWALSRYLRCPKCQKLSLRNWMRAKHCPYCGTALEEE